MMLEREVENKIKNMNMCIVKHTLTPKGGVEEELLNFLKGKVENLMYISHPFKEAEIIPLYTEIFAYKNGILAKQIKMPLILGPLVLFYIKDVLFTFWYIFKTGLVFDVFIGVDNLNALTGYLLKKAGRVRKVVFYVIDYSPKRFSNKLMNSIYHAIDRFVCCRVDRIWNLSDAMMEGRKERGMNIKKCSPHITVPHGNRFKSIKRYDIDKIERHRIAYLGQLRKEQGAGKLIDIFYGIKNMVRDASLIVIGTGELEDSMRKRVDELNIGGSVRFAGFVEDNSTYEELLARSAVGIAPYPSDARGYKRYSDPGKIKTYLACGLPVVTTNVPPIASKINDKKSGFAVDDDIKEIKDALFKLLTDDGLYKTYKENAISMGSDYDWSNIFNNALSLTL